MLSILFVATSLIGARGSASNHSIDLGKICGASDCPSRVEKSSNGTLDKVADQHSVIVLMGIFAGGIFLSGVFIIIFVDNLKTDKDGKRILIKSQVSAVGRMAFKDKRMLALLPIQIYAGLLPGFVAVDFSKVVSSTVCLRIFLTQYVKDKSFNGLVPFGV